MRAIWGVREGLSAKTDTGSATATRAQCIHSASAAAESTGQAAAASGSTKQCARHRRDSEHAARSNPRELEDIMGFIHAKDAL